MTIDKQKIINIILEKHHFKVDSNDPILVTTLLNEALLQAYITSFNDSLESYHNRLNKLKLFQEKHNQITTNKINQLLEQQLKQTQVLQEIQQQLNHNQNTKQKTSNNTKNKSLRNILTFLDIIAISLCLGVIIGFLILWVT